MGLIGIITTLYTLELMIRATNIRIEMCEDLLPNHIRRGLSNDWAMDRHYWTMLWWPTETMGKQADLTKSKKNRLHKRENQTNGSRKLSVHTNIHCRAKEWSIGCVNPISY